MCHSGDQRSLTRALCPSTRRAHWLPASRTTISRPPPRRSDWSDAGECDVEFDRLISGRGSYKGGIGGVMLSTDREEMLREAAAEPARTTEDVSVEWQERERKKSGWEVVCIMVITWHTTAVYWRNLNYIHRSNPESSHRIAVNLETRCWKRCNSVGECYSAGESDRHQLQIGSPDCAFFFLFFFFYPFLNFYYWVSASYICFCLCLLSYYSWTAHWHHSHNPSKALQTCFLSLFRGAVPPYE